MDAGKALMKSYWVNSPESLGRALYLELKFAGSRSDYCDQASDWSWFKWIKRQGLVLLIQFSKRKKRLNVAFACTLAFFNQLMTFQTQSLDVSRKKRLAKINQNSKNS